MPIYEFACPQCRVIYNFLSKRVNPERAPVCPKCGNKKLAKQMSRFSALSPSSKSADEAPAEDATLDEPRMLQAMSELERDMEHLDENNPRHMAHMIKKMKGMM